MSRARAKEARAPTQQKMTHNMMTRSKTRAAAYNPGYIRKVPCALCNIGLEYDEFRCWWRSEKLPPKCQACLIKEDPDYDCLENNPRCPCGLLLSMDDMAVWEEDESKTPMCEACLDEMENESDDKSDDKSNDESNDDDDDAACELCGNERDDCKVGCCNDGNCPYKVESMCDNCATWYEREGVWRCIACANVYGGGVGKYASKKIPHNIWKNMEKVIRDGLNTYHGSIYDQAEYKDLCLGIVLNLLKNECNYCEEDCENCD